MLANRHFDKQQVQRFLGIIVIALVIIAIIVVFIFLSNKPSSENNNIITNIGTTVTLESGVSFKVDSATLTKQANPSLGVFETVNSFLVVEITVANSPDNLADKKESISLLYNGKTELLPTYLANSQRSPTLATYTVIFSVSNQARLHDCDLVIKATDHQKIFFTLFA